MLLLWSRFQSIWCIISCVLYYVAALVTVSLVLMHYFWCFVLFCCSRHAMTVNHWFYTYLASGPFSDLNSGSRTEECCSVEFAMGDELREEPCCCSRHGITVNHWFDHDLASGPFSELNSKSSTWNSPWVMNFRDNFRLAASARNLK